MSNPENPHGDETLDNLIATPIEALIDEKSYYNARLKFAKYLKDEELLLGLSLGYAMENRTQQLLVQILGRIGINVSCFLLRLNNERYNYCDTPKLQILVRHKPVEEYIKYKISSLKDLGICYVDLKLFTIYTDDKFIEERFFLGIKINDKYFTQLQLSVSEFDRLYEKAKEL